MSETQAQLEQHLKELIIRELALDDVAAHEIDSAAPLFGDGLALDSIDALELALAIEKLYGVKIEREGTETQEAFSSVRSLANFLGTRV